MTVLYSGKNTCWEQNEKKAYLPMPANPRRENWTETLISEPFQFIFDERREKQEFSQSIA